MFINIDYVIFFNMISKIYKSTKYFFLGVIKKKHPNRTNYFFHLFDIEDYY